MQGRLLFSLKEKFSIFPNPQPIAKPLPAVGLKLNKPVGWKGKWLGWRRAQNGAEGPHSSPVEPAGSCYHHCCSFLLNPRKRKRGIFGRPLLHPRLCSSFLHLFFTILWHFPVQELSSCRDGSGLAPSSASCIHHRIKGEVIVLWAKWEIW